MRCYTTGLDSGWRFTRTRIYSNCAGLGAICVSALVGANVRPSWQKEIARSPTANDDKRGKSRFRFLAAKVSVILRNFAHRSWQYGWRWAGKFSSQAEHVLRQKVSVELVSSRLGFQVKAQKSSKVPRTLDLFNVFNQNCSKWSFNFKWHLRGVRGGYCEVREVLHVQSFSIDSQSFNCVRSPSINGAVMTAKIPVNFSGANDSSRYDLNG